MKRERALVGVALVALVVLGTFAALARCTATEPRPAPVSPSEIRTSEPVDEAPAAVGKSVAAPPAPPSVAAPASGTPNAPSVVASSESALSLAPPTSSAGSRIARALAASRTADLELLGRIERELGRDPPPEIHAMLRRGREGASRDELLGMARGLPDLQLRVHALRWVDDVRPAAGAKATAPGVPAPGSAAPLVKRIEPAP